MKDNTKNDFGKVDEKVDARMLGKVTVAIRGHVDEMKARYPKEINIEGLEPALTADIARIVAEFVIGQRRRVWKKGHSTFFDVTWDVLGMKGSPLKEKWRLILNQRGDRAFREEANRDGCDISN